MIPPPPKCHRVGRGGVTPAWCQRLTRRGAQQVGTERAERPRPVARELSSRAASVTRSTGSDPGGELLAAGVVKRNDGGPVVGGVDIAGDQPGADRLAGEPADRARRQAPTGGEVADPDGATARRVPGAVRPAPWGGRPTVSRCGSGAQRTLKPVDSLGEQTRVPPRHPGEANRWGDYVNQQLWGRPHLPALGPADRPRPPPRRQAHSQPVPPVVPLRVVVGLGVMALPLWLDRHHPQLLRDGSSPASCSPTPPGGPGSRPCASTTPITSSACAWTTTSP